MRLFESDKSATRLPVLVITGVLGSGKTTLLNRLLRHPEMSDSAVIINEWGEIGIDHLLVETIDGEVAAGAAASAARSAAIWKRRSGDCWCGATGAKSRHFVGCSWRRPAIADPAPIMQMMLNNPLVSHFVRLDAVVTTVDAVNAPRQLAEHPEAVKQVAIADRLLLTKADLCDTASVSVVESQLSRLNPGATVIAAAYGDVPPGHLFGAALFDPARKTPDVQAWLRPERHEHHGSTHDDNDRGIRSFCLTFDDPLSWPAVSSWLMMLRQWRGEDLLRVKGILHLQEEELPVAIHGVHHVFHPPVQLSSWPEGDRRSRVVFITRGLERAEVEETWSLLKDRVLLE